MQYCVEQNTNMDFLYEFNSLIAARVKLAIGYRE